MSLSERYQGNIVLGAHVKDLVTGFEEHPVSPDAPSNCAAPNVGPSKP